MTREQAEKEIRDTFTKVWADGIIKALEQEPTTKNNLEVDWDELKRKILMEVDGGTDDKWFRYADVCDNISNSIDDFKAYLPPVTPQAPKTGHWMGDSYGYICSNCEHSLNDLAQSMDYISFSKPKYCPNCGCRMVESPESEDKE